MAAAGELAGQAAADGEDQLLPILACHAPQFLFRQARHLGGERFGHPAPTLLPARCRPEMIGARRVPARHVHAVGHMTDRNLGLRPAWKQWLKQSAADMAVEFADAKALQ